MAIYMWREQWWQPWANTLIYYPLTSDLVDVMWNGDTWTMAWTCTFDTDTGVHVTWQNRNYIYGLSNWVWNKNTFTVNVWIKYESYSSVWYIAWYWASSTSWQSWNIALYGSYIQWMTASGSSTQNWTNLVAEDHNWHNIWCVGNGDGTYTWYCDGVSVWTQNTWTLNNVTELQLWWGGTYGSGRTCSWYVKDYIVETTCWTAQEISDYYDLTKSLYWIS